MQYGAAVAMTKYFAKRSMEDSSFKHFEDTSEEGEISNVVWTDAKMIASYVRFGDVVIFDTTFGTNNEKWAVGTFVGFNHLREIVIFGAALMCDQNIESFEWVFTKFLEAHGGKKCITMFTDQDAAIAHALEKIMPDTKHGLCTWHINKNCVKHLAKLNDKDNHITKKFNACLYRYEEEKEFEDAINFLMEQVDDEGKKWLDFIYISKEKVLEQNREKEIKSEYAMRSKLPKLKFKMPILCEASNLYTPKVFELFQAEVELFMLSHIECLEGNTYTVGKFAIDNEIPCKSRQVVWNREDQMISCSCKKFERVGILCWHALKVLDREDIKVIPPRYILNRWTKAAKDVAVVDIEGRRVIEDPMLDVRNRKADMVRIGDSIFDEAAYIEEDTHFVRNMLLEMQQKYQQYKEKRSGGEGNLTTEHSLHLKKKNGGDRRSKRIPSCIEKKKRAKKAKNKTISNSQDLIRMSINPSQDISEGNFGCFSDLEDL
ncbi:hypothetical protein LUZ63_004047 [Rhynchospora breviuscula]|uniref:SWIM-type domain-containing protein n=1 Tax=Rhynchospora breviuscula TaxID=2022672 RepID=A0A9Q0D2D1_9POAL|nr:hypothetical protein LUZ63_004047 [Rhynchospora breviuscula]